MIENSIGNYLPKIAYNTHLKYKYVWVCVINTLNEVIPLGILILPPGAIDHLTKTLVPCMRNSLLRFWSGVSGKLPKQYRLLLLLKTPLTSDTGLGGFELELIWKPPLRSTLHHSKGVMHAAKSQL